MVGPEIERIFNASPDPVEVRIENFPKYVRRQHLTRLLALYEVFKRIIGVKGSIVECGVNRGYGLMAWAKLSAVLEPVNLTRRIYGFDSFAGFPAVSDKDRTGPAWQTAEPGALHADSYAELLELISLYDGESNLQVKATLIRAFGESQQKAAVRKLIQIARSDPSIELRKLAVRLLGESKDPEALKFLEELLK